MALLLELRLPKRKNNEPLENGLPFSHEITSPDKTFSFAEQGQHSYDVINPVTLRERADPKLVSPPLGPTLGKVKIIKAEHFPRENTTWTQVYYKVLETSSHYEPKSS